MLLVIFDIDGTLTDSTRIDEECFVRALADVYCYSDIETDWTCYKHTTDSGIFREIHQARTGQLPSAADTTRFREYFIKLLEQATTKSPIAPIPGAPQLLASLSRSAEYRTSLATGAWSDSARLKMASAGLCYDDYPAASSDDAFERESIIKLSMRRAMERRVEFDSVVYVGDGVWDARACRAVGIPFIGIADGIKATRLSTEGAVRVFADLSDGDAFVDSLCQQSQRRSAPHED